MKRCLVKATTDHHKAKAVNKSPFSQTCISSITCPHGIDLELTLCITRVLLNLAPQTNLALKVHLTSCNHTINLNYNSELILHHQRKSAQLHNNTRNTIDPTINFDEITCDRRTSLYASIISSTRRGCPIHGAVLVDSSIRQSIGLFVVLPVDVVHEDFPALMLQCPRHMQHSIQPR